MQTLEPKTEAAKMAEATNTIGGEGVKLDAKPEEKYVMPDLSMGPASFFDTETSSFWVGLPVGKMDLFTATVLLDRCKFDLLGHFQAYALRKQNQSKIVKPTWAEKARENAALLKQKLFK